MGNMLNLTNQRFGRLIAISPLDERKNKKVIWKCKCDCGNYINVVSTQLTSGKTKSCGCLALEVRKNNGQNKIIDLTGQKFGKWKVLQRDKTKNGAVYWLCQCDCGNQSKVRGSHLKDGTSTKCKNCANKEHQLNTALFDEMVDKKFGLLTVKKIANKPLNTTYNGTFWYCDCDCGKTDVIINGGAMRSGYVFSCGCMSNSKGENLIENILKENNILYNKQQTFNTCRFKKSNSLARFDFYLPEYNTIIEFDGIQHFQYKNSGWNTKDNFEKTQEHDQFKNQWCANNNITLIRIPYTHFQQISINDLLPQTSTFIYKQETKNE